MHQFTVAAGVVVSLTLGAIAQGAISYQYVTDQDIYVVGPDNKVTLKVYLKETTSTTSLLASENGLAGVGFSIEGIEGSGFRIIGGTSGPGFTPAIALVHASGQAVTGSFYTSSFTSGPTAVNGLVELATLSFEATGPTAYMKFAVGPDAPGSTVTLANFLDLDVSTDAGFVSYTGAGDVQPFEFTIAVPEPVSAMFAGMVGILVCRRPAKRDRV